MSERKWYQWHATTWIAVVIVTVTMLWANCHVRGGGRFGFGKTNPVWEQGWPTTARWETYRHVPNVWPPPPPTFGHPANQVHKEPLEILINTTAFVLIFAATAFACEQWRRRGIRPWQFNTGFMLSTITVVAILWWLHGHADSLAKQWTSETGLLAFLPRYDYYNWLEEFPWFASAPLVFGECCLVYVVALLVVKGGQWLANSAPPRPWYRPHLSSLLAGALVAAALLAANGELRSGKTVFHSRSYQGWPANFRVFWEEYRHRRDEYFRPEDDYFWHLEGQYIYYETYGTDFFPTAAAIDLGVGLLLVAGSFVASEILRRRGPRGLVRLQTALGALVIEALLWGMHAGADRLYAWSSGDQDVYFWRQHPVQEDAWHVALQPFGSSETGRFFVSYPWQYPFGSYVVVPIYVAEGCVIFVAAWLLWRLISLARQNFRADSIQE